MHSPEIEAALARNVRTMRIIVFALVTGASIFAVLVVVLRLGDNFPPNGQLLFTLISVFYAAMMFLIHFFFPNRIAANARRDIVEGKKMEMFDKMGVDIPGDLGKLCAIFRVRLIIGAALLEGSVFFSLMAFLIEGQLVTLIVAILFIVGLALKFPSQEGLERWLEEQQELLEQTRAERRVQL